ncbi:MAG: ABC transporter permease [Actinomycetota bacterium]|nr:ABC transporter permease [Actinomycetota bacterium]
MNFLHLIWVEMRRALHRRVVWWMVALALASCAFVGFIVFVTSDGITPFTDFSHPAYARNWSFASDDGGFLGVGGVFLAIGAAICGASVAGAEWKAGTITTVLTWAPSRWRLHTARTISAFILAFLIGLALLVVFLASAVPAVIVNGSTDGTGGDYWNVLGLAMLRLAFVSALLAVLAFNIATIGRNTAPALVALAIWALVGENIIRGLRPKVARFLITDNLGIVIEWGTFEDAGYIRGPGLALATLLLYLAIFVGAGLVSFTRRDIAGSS